MVSAWPHDNGNIDIHPLEQVSRNCRCYFEQSLAKNNEWETDIACSRKKGEEFRLNEGQIKSNSQWENGCEGNTLILGFFLDTTFRNHARLCLETDFVPYSRAGNNTSKKCLNIWIINEAWSL